MYQNRSKYHTILIWATEKNLIRTNGSQANYCLQIKIHVFWGLEFYFSGARDFIILGLEIDFLGFVSLAYNLNCNVAKEQTYYVFARTDARKSRHLYLWCVLKAQCLHTHKTNIRACTKRNLHKHLSSRVVLGPRVRIHSRSYKSFPFARIS